ncbi:MAG: hypothetical protein C0622_12135 [Desulfuromonas sp.]|nr:MAG: hypothetical protein C0622_12135 [Desulfuromonas sp.]
MRNGLLALLCLLFLGACTTPVSNYSNSGNELPQLRVQAEATVKALPDLLRLRLGVVTTAVDAGQALADNNQRMGQLMALLEELGISGDELATGQFQIRPEWSLPPRPTPANWQREIVGYRVENELQVETPKVELAGKLLGLAQRAGANQVGNLQFDLADPESYRQEAITLATQKAVAKAQTLAAAAGTELGEIISISLDSPTVMYRSGMVDAEVRMATAQAVPVVADKVEVSAGVTMVYRLLNPPVKGS